MLFLASELSDTAYDIVSRLDRSPQGQNLAFITTAAEAETGDKAWLQADHQALTDVGFNVRDLTLTGLNEEQLDQALMDIDVVVMAGGNTFYLLQRIYESGFDQVITRLLDRGVTYIGSSAGSLVAGPEISMISPLDDPARAPGLTTTRGLGIIDTIVFPHWGEDVYRAAYVQAMTLAYDIPHKKVLLSNSQYLWVHGEEMTIVETKDSAV